ncbi:flippase-like domain-containing protein [Candidatus Pacearchaeota archaeon]|nr:flippase-like domain-containing protein [Candidatus Pacearchaeota archaeon]
MTFKKRYFSWLIAVLLLIGLGYILKSIGIKEILELISKANPFYLLLSLVSLFLMFFLWNVVWVKSLREIEDNNFSYFGTLPAFFSGVLFNTITPGARVGGDPIRIYYLSKKYKGSKSKYLASVLYQKALNFIANIVFAIFSLLALFLLFKFESIRKIFLITLFLIILIIILVVLAVISRKGIKKIVKKFSFAYVFFKHKFKNKKEFQKYLVTKYDLFASTFRQLLKNKTLTAYLFLLTILSRLALYASVFLIFLALGIELTFVFAVIATTLINLFEDIAGIPGGIGLAESGSILIYKLFGLSGAAAASTSLLYRGEFYFFSIIIGLAFYIYAKHSAKKK